MDCGSIVVLQYNTHSTHMKHTKQISHITCYARITLLTFITYITCITFVLPPPALNTSTTLSEDPKPSDSGATPRTGLPQLPAGPTPPMEGTPARERGEQACACYQVASARSRACHRLQRKIRRARAAAPTGWRHLVGAHPHKARCLLQERHPSLPLWARCGPAAGPLLSARSSRPAVGQLFLPTRSNNSSNSNKNKKKT